MDRFLQSSSKILLKSREYIKGFLNFEVGYQKSEFKEKEK